MMNIKGIFAVSLIAMVAMVAGAHTSNAVAAIASQGYVDQQVGSKLSSISGSTTGSGNVVTSVSASGSTVSVTKGITAEETKNKVTSTNYAANVSSDTKYPTVKAVAGAIADVEKKIPAAITVDSALSSTSTNPVQNKVINTALNGKVATAQGPNAVSKAVITNASGNITTGTISSAMITDGTITNADIATDAQIAASKVYGLSNVATSGSYNDLDDTPTIPTVNNATLTIQKNGATVDTFTANASADKTINITVPTKTSELDNDSGFVTSANLPVATANTLGGVKSGGDITVDTSGAVTVNSATQADSATTATNAKNAVRAENDAEGNNIILTYAKKSDIPTASDILTATTVTSSGTGAVLTGVSVTDGKVTLQKGNVQIPSGGQNATSYVSIWVE